MDAGQPESRNAAKYTVNQPSHTSSAMVKVYKGD